MRQLHSLKTNTYKTGYRDLYVDIVTLYNSEGDPLEEHLYAYNINYGFKLEITFSKDFEIKTTRKYTYLVNHLQLIYDKIESQAFKFYKEVKI